MNNNLSFNPDYFLITIIIPTFNRINLISETLDSVLNQTYQNWECIIIDDGSDDGTQEIIKKYLLKDHRFNFIQRYREPKGASCCRNIGIDKAQGEYIIFLDSDDLLKNDCLENRINFAKKNPNFDFWVFPTSVFRQTPSDTKKVWNILNNKHNDFIRFIRLDNPWQTTGAFWRKSILNNINGFDEAAQCSQDWELHVRILLKGYTYYKADNYFFDNFYRLDYNNEVQTIGKLANKKTYIIESRIVLYKKIYKEIRDNNFSEEIKKAIAIRFYRFFSDLAKDRNQIYLKKAINSLPVYESFGFIRTLLLKLMIFNFYNIKINYLIYKYFDKHFFKNYNFLNYSNREIEI